MSEMSNEDLLEVVRGHRALAAEQVLDLRLVAELELVATERDDRVFGRVVSRSPQQLLRDDVGAGLHVGRATRVELHDELRAGDVAHVGA